MRRYAAALLVALGACAETAAPPPRVETLVREGATPTTVRRADLDGDGSPEIVVASTSAERSEFGLPIPYVEMFDHTDHGWVRVFDATGAVPPGSPPGAGPILERAGAVVGEALESVETVDFAGDGSAEVVLVVLNAGASAGPLELWILSMAGGEVRTAFATSTQRGGRVTIGDDVVELVFGVYRPDDPGCCPSRIERQTIGWDEETGRVAVLSTERRRTKVRG